MNFIQRIVYGGNPWNLRWIQNLRFCDGKYVGRDSLTQNVIQTNLFLNRLLSEYKAY